MWLVLTPGAWLLVAKVGTKIRHPLPGHIPGNRSRVGRGPGAGHWRYLHLELCRHCVCRYLHLEQCRYCVCRYLQLVAGWGGPLGTGSLLEQSCVDIVRIDICTFLCVDSAV